MLKFNATMYGTPTAAMDTLGFNWFDVGALVEHTIKVLDEEGATAIEVVTGILKCIRFATRREMAMVFLELNEVVQDVTKLIAAIRSEFGM